MAGRRGVNPGWRDPSHDEDIARLHAEGKGRNEIARELELSSSVVSYSAKVQGLKFDGSQVLMATEVRRREAQDRRAILSVALLDDVEKLRERLFAPLKYTQYGGKNFERRDDLLDQPMPQDQASLARSIGMLLDRAIKLDEYDKVGATLDDAYNFLDGVQIVIRGEVVPIKELGAADDGDDRTEQ
jgi:hypothetical protein